MSKKTHTVSIRLLRDHKQPDEAVREGVTLSEWDKLEGAKIALDTLNGGTPKWAKFLNLTEQQKKAIFNVTAYGLIFLSTKGRWFALSFGLGHVKLDPDAFEQDFGLRVVLNTVAPTKLRSADIRTPDENTTTRRTQTARRSDQTAFSIDIERDIVRGLAGEPHDTTFALRVAGSDGLTLTKEMDVGDLPQVCADALTAFSKTDYKTNFGWVDQIKHVRDKALIEKLNVALAAALHGALTGPIPDTLHLAYPVIYDPEKARHIQFKGFRSTNIHTDLEISAYMADLKERGVTAYAAEHLVLHKAHECDANGKDEGGSWKIKECLVFEAEVDGQKYVLSGDRWYCIEANLAKEVSDFFATIPIHTLPLAEANDNEESYNKRVASGGHDLLCLDRKTVKPTGANYAIEACDFLGKDGAFVHVKDHTSSSRLSHLFNQGTVSARVLKMDGAFRDLLRVEIGKQEAAFALTGYQAQLAGASTSLDPAKHKVIYGVLCAQNTARLPFFSLVTFRQAAKDLQALGFSCAFAWIKKPASTKAKKPRKPKGGGAP
ncbi:MULTISPECIES: DUF6119 family protein [unclassified Bosea (in: a-proteobacteria)]|uniref:DUF6119 family protein n=1 Tax=unclassified Bosea (in: a-proteobacteria) TaxID=2653178 RepID=UPI00125F5225|nr:MULTISPECIES: DUF6119 family protein [unclassified Bosea (in: a-proteobacteria)]CAD5257319.1 conserved hypothetical protein [Bosea sp. 7B]VXC23324.1 conserved hypothetical protein [Bosea sp. 127]VXC62516.1 conserved hypothetical protein [Bosea sp. 125]